MTQTQTNSSRRYTRRGVMRRTALGVGAAAGLGGIASTTVAAVNLTKEQIITAGGIALSPPGWAVKQLYDRLTDPPTGEDVRTELTELNEEETYTSVREDAIEMESVDDRVLTSIQNVIQGLDRRAYQKGIEVAIEGMNGGNSESEVLSAAQSAANDVITVTQKNFLDHFQTQAAKTMRLAVEMDRNATAEDMPGYVDGSQMESGAGTLLHVSPATPTSEDVSLADSTTYSINPLSITGGGNSTHYLTYSPASSDAVGFDEVRIEPFDTGEQVVFFDYNRYQSIWDTTNSISSTVESELSSWLSTVYPKYSAGDIPLEDVVTADQLAATASEQNDLSNVTADFAAVGIPINDRTTLTIEIVAGENSGTIIEGNLAVRNPPTDGFIVGNTYDPANITGPVWLMYDRTTDSGEKEGDVIQLESKFKVIDAEGYDGEPISNVTFEEKTQERYSTDIQELNNQLDKLAEYQNEIQEERDALIEEEATAGAGGGFFSGSEQNWGLIAIGAGAVALGWGYFTEDSS